MSWDSFALLAVSSVSCAIARAFELEEVLISNLRDYDNFRQNCIKKIMHPKSSV
jgi:hypothetical protein